MPPRIGSIEPMAQRTKLRQIREELGLSQEMLARRTRSISVETFRSAERGNRVHYASAVQILEAVNLVRQEKGLPMLQLEDLEIDLL